VFEVGAGVDASELRALDERVQDRGSLSAAPRAQAEVIDPSDDRSAQRTLAGVIVQRHARIVEEDDETFPQAAHVLDRLAQAAARQLADAERPLLDLFDDRP